MTAPPVAGLRDVVLAAVRAVDDPELPGVSIVDLGLLERLEVDEHDGSVCVGLIPTFTGCPALELIRRDVASAVSSVPEVSSVVVEFLGAPVWSRERITAEGRRQLAGGLGVAVAVESLVRCPRCEAATSRVSLFGPTRCRAVHRCSGCGEVVEVIR